jgi:hypothetical protein
MFSTSELESIKKQTKPDSKKPFYYSAQQRLPAQISNNFEGFLILQKTDIKQKALAWIKSANSIEEKNKERDDLLIEYSAIRKQDSEERLIELDQRTSDFNSFRSNFVTSDGSDPSRFANIPEVVLVLNSLQKPVDSIFIQREQAFHELNLIAVTDTKITIEKTTTDTLKELNSWQTVISAYRGQS